MAYTKLKPRFTPDAKVEEISQDEHTEIYRLSIPAGPANQYRLAQLDDYTKFSRSRFPLRYPLKVNLSARASGDSIPGTWGFGLWNDPFGLSLGFGENPFRLPTLPNAVWFFGASKESYLSFRPEQVGAFGATQSTAKRARGKDMPQTRFTSDDSTSENNRASTTDFTKSASSSAPPAGTSQRGVAVNGFLAQTFRSPKFHPSLIPAGLALPFSRKRARQLLGRVIEEDGIALSINFTQWHDYTLEWHTDRVSFDVDDIQVFESEISPNPPLGLVIWIDNQFAAFTPEGKIGFGVLANPEPAWLEIKDIDVM